ncbi:aminotransferase-like domain-containing protein [Cohnella xylanilytica]|uniref:aminotransferase-like domain-containing protein n=1 Tax=Cohnella xylanilytica TaxID=557555 RepID=UPI003570DB6B
MSRAWEAEEDRLLYRRVYDSLRRRLESGEWGPHDKLPSVRQLAARFGVNRLTALRAYRMLAEENRVYAKEKSGFYASPPVPRVGANATDSGMDEVEPSPSGPRPGNPMSEIQSLPVEYQLSQGIVDPGLLPNLFLSEYVKSVFDLYPKLMGTYSNPQGDEELRESVARYLTKDTRVPLSADDLVITTGGQQAIDLLARLYIGRGDAMLVERPTYSSAIDIFRQQGVRFLPVDITSAGYDLERVETLMKLHKPKAFYLNPTYHNPTGYTVPAAQRKRLVELAERYRCLLVEDDSFREMYFGEPPPRPLYAYDTSGWVVHLRSFSKHVAPGLRVCAVAARPGVIRPLVTAKSLADNGTPLVGQKLFLRYFESERFGRHLEKLRIAMRLRKETMEKELAGGGWTWDSPKGGLNLWVRLPEGLSSSELLEESLRQSVSFVPGLICDPLRETDTHLRISYSFVGEAILKEGTRRLTELARRLAERNSLGNSLGSSLGRLMS